MTSPHLPILDPHPSLHTSTPHCVPRSAYTSVQFVVLLFSVCFIFSSDTGFETCKLESLSLHWVNGNLDDPHTLCLGRSAFAHSAEHTSSWDEWQVAHELWVPLAEGEFKTHRTKNRIIYRFRFWRRSILQLISLLCLQHSLHCWCATRLSYLPESRSTFIEFARWLHRTLRLFPKTETGWASIHVAKVKRSTDSAS